MCDSLVEKAAPKYTMKFFFAQPSGFETIGTIPSCFRSEKFPVGYAACNALEAVSGGKVLPVGLSRGSRI